MPVFIKQSWTWSRLSPQCQPKHKAGLWSLLTSQLDTSCSHKALPNSNLQHTKITLSPGYQKGLSHPEDRKAMEQSVQSQTFSRADWRVSQAPRSDLTADPAWSRRLDQIISQGPFQMELCCESQLSPPLTHAGTGLTLLSWVTWHFHSWYIHFLKHLTPY